ncbi:hypothetical protein Gotur_002322 [Gossypium turneri]
MVAGKFSMWESYKHLVNTAPQLDDDKVIWKLKALCEFGLSYGYCSRHELIASALAWTKAYRSPRFKIGKG